MTKLAKRDAGDQVTRGAQTAGAIFLVLAWVILAGSGAQIAFAVLTMDWWVKALPVILGMAILNGLLAIWKGFAAMRVPRLAGVVILLILIVCDLLTVSLSSRRLTAFDRGALVAFLISFGFAFAKFPSVIGFALMLCCLAVAWGNNHIRRTQP
jgi:hypothetical protein